MISQPFNSFLMGGFECSTHKDRGGRRLDLISSTRHDEFATQDYARLAELGIRTCRDGLRWHLIEREPFRYDFSSVKNQVAASHETGVQVMWDYFHYGYPDDIDIFSEEFLERFTSFSRATTEYLRSEFGDNIVACPVNEISFFSWIAGTAGAFHPARRRRGHELKEQLVKAAIVSTRTIRSVSASAKIMFTDPAIHVVTNQRTRSARLAAEKYRLAQFEAFDMLMGLTSPEFGGSPDIIDVIGLNYYFHNQWFFANRRKIAPDHKLYRPLSSILEEFYLRYDKPLLIAETGIEDDERPEWFRYVSEQTAEALSLGVPVYGICLYPIVNHPGWADDRHCHNGLWDYADDSGQREIYSPLAQEIAAQSELLGSPADLQMGAKRPI
jgi:beta-glucosidase/6-phospho-beta-glucosidase/beta-galactosidase